MRVNSNTIQIIFNTVVFPPVMHIPWVETTPPGESCHEQASAWPVLVLKGHLVTCCCMSSVR